MKKRVPDPPNLHLVQTAETLVKSCPEHSPLFSVCAGVRAEDALVHAHLYLKYARATAAETLQYTCESGRDFARSTQHSLELACALIDALLDGIELSTVPTLEPPH